MKHMDVRVKQTHEMLNGIKVNGIWRYLIHLTVKNTLLAITSGFPEGRVILLRCDGYQGRWCDVQVIKLYAWEKSFMDRIQGVRNKELGIMRKASYLNAFSSFMWMCVPFMVRHSSFDYLFAI